MGRASGQSRVRAGAVLRGAAERAETLSLLENARNLRMAVQPILDLRTGRLSGFEALARFADGRPPDVCFAQAHAQGLGERLEAAAVRAALALPKRPAGTYLGINLSASALASDDVQAVLPKKLGGILIEITEHEPLGDDPALRQALDDARTRGALLAVDDAGSGYAGLKQVANLAPDIVKLDRTLIQGVHEDPVKAALIESFVRYARAIGAVVCAEGIETMEELTRLAELDVGYGQGYGIARPGRPYPQADRDAVMHCAASLSQTLLSLPERLTEDANDRRLEALTALLSEARSFRDLSVGMAPIAEELRADAVYLSMLDGEELVTLGSSGPDLTGERYSLAKYPATRAVLERREVVQVLATDETADPTERDLMVELGYRANLMLPVMCSGETIGLLEVFAHTERPWTRFEIRRARIITYQLGAVLERVARNRRANGLPTFV